MLFRILRLLELNPHLSQRELSESLGVSLVSVNNYLHSLIPEGAIKISLLEIIKISGCAPTY